MLFGYSIYIYIQMKLR